MLEENKVNLILDGTMKRNPWIAAFLSLLAFGLGQIYNGQPKKGFLVLLAYPGFIFFGAVFSLVSIKSGPAPVLTIAWLALYLMAVWSVVDAFVTARKLRFFGPRRYNRISIYLLVFVGSVMVNSAVRAYVGRQWIEPYSMPSDSMIPTLLRGDRFIVDKRYGKGRKNLPLQRGELIVYAEPGASAVIYVKRIVGLPGDRVEIKGKSIFVNGKEVKAEPIVEFSDKLLGALLPSGSQAYRESMVFGRSHVVFWRDDDNSRIEVTVPEGNVFVMGDNRSNSRDSRDHGSVPSQSIVGKPVQIWFSLDWDGFSIRWWRFARLLE